MGVSGLPGLPLLGPELRIVMETTKTDFKIIPGLRVRYLVEFSIPHTKQLPIADWNSHTQRHVMISRHVNAAIFSPTSRSPYFNSQGLDKWCDHEHKVGLVSNTYHHRSFYTTGNPSLSVALLKGKLKIVMKVSDNLGKSPRCNSSDLPKE